ncbi:hypothetical protein [Cupriavidus sp. D39]|uniref:hypothetical protein n=1 Tax=Cupriavidus sp. D39 TaxID=2997877 RepID=UPI0022715B2A|nr:hypothetical protein [Cupriavidus sp. D39]MCY0852449.1 hypothetical protein [Cupriavidus sp. D39]
MQKTFRDKEGNLVEVVSVEVAPHAGGISRTLTRVAFSEQFVPAEDRVYRQVQVTLEEPADLSLLAYWNGTRWHGWPVPELALVEHPAACPALA